MIGHDPEADIRAERDFVANQIKVFPELLQLSSFYNQHHPGSELLDFWKLYVAPRGADDVCVPDVRAALTRTYGPDYVSAIRKMIPYDKRKVQQRRGVLID